MATRPSTLPEWATTGTRVSPSGAKRNAGFAVREAIPSTLANALFGEVGDWVEYLDEVATDHEGRVEDLEDTAVLSADDAALADLDDNRVCTVRQTASSGPGTVVSATRTAIAGANVIDIACDGEWVWVAYSAGGPTNYFVRRYSRATLTIDATWNYTTGATAIASIACAGGDVFIARTTDLVRVLRSDSTSATVLAAGGSVDRVRTNGAAVWAVVGNTVRRTTVALGSWTWTYDHGAAVRDIAPVPTRTTTTTDVEVALAGAVGSTTSAVNYGGVVLSSAGAKVSVFRDETAEPNGLRSVACDGRRLYWGDQGSVHATPVLGVSAVITGLWNTFVSANNLTRLVAGGMDVYAIDTTDDRLHALCSSTGSYQWAFAGGAGLVLERAGHDVSGLVVGGESGGTYQLQRLTDGHSPRLVSKRTATDTARWPYHQLLVPLGGS